LKQGQKVKGLHRQMKAFFRALGAFGRQDYLPSFED
jgi:hypothetical protein